MLIASIIVSAAILISEIVLNLPIPILIVEFINGELSPILLNTWDGLGEDEVQAEPEEIAILGNVVIIDCPFKEGKLRLMFPGILFSRSPFIIVSGILEINAWRITECFYGKINQSNTLREWKAKESI